MRHYWAMLLLLGGLGCRPSSEITAAPDFVSVPASVSGLRYRSRLTGPRPCTILGTIGNGVAFLDYNNDGSLDVLCIGEKPALFVGDGKGKFRDVSPLLRVSPAHFLGCGVGDYDNDGYSDIYLSGYNTGRLLRNRDGKGFEDITEAAGLSPQPWGSSVSFVDVDGDNDLDLVVGNYIEFSPRHRQYCPQGNINLACSPNDYFPAKPVLYRNGGDGTFQPDASDKKLSDYTNGKTLGVAAADIDRSGVQTLYLANDQVPGDMVRFQGGKLESFGTEAGVAYAASGTRQAGMGTDFGDYDNDGRLDLAVATYEHEVKPIYRNQGDRLFSDQSAALGVATPLLPYIAFGVKWIDADNDGWLDLLYTNGHVADNIQEHLKDARFRQPSVFLQNQGGRQFRQISLPALETPLVGRGIAVGDYDNDGKTDALLVDSDGDVRLLHNETVNAGNFLQVALVGTKSNRDAYGAEVEITAGGRRLVRHCHTDGSYLSASDARVHFGLGRADRIDRLHIRWPSGAETTKTNLPVNQQITIIEGS